MSLETLTRIRGGGRLIIRLLPLLPTGILMAWSANYLRQHGNGINVDAILAAICDELAKRSGIDFCRAEITSVPNETTAVNDNFTNELLLIAVGGVIAFFLWQYFTRRSPARV